MFTDFSFRSRGDDGFGELLVFLHSFGQLHTTDFAYTTLVSTPCATAKITAYNHFDGETFAHHTHRYHRVGCSCLPVRANVSSSIQEFGCNLIQHLSFERNAFRQNNVECRDTVSCYHDQFFTIDVINITYFSVVYTFLSRKIKICFC